MKEEVIALSQKEVNKYSIIKDLLDCKLKNKEAARLLNLSVRQVIRLKKKLKRAGLKGRFHGRAPCAFLIAAIDDATGEVPYALFVDSASTPNNMQVIKAPRLKKCLP